MAKLECELKGNFHTILQELDKKIMTCSSSVSREDESEFNYNNSHCIVRIYERYSFSGGNRVSLNLTLFQSGEKIWLSAITSGGSTGMFLKINTFGESAFLDCIRGTVAKYRI